jgi:UPF0271 protein
MTATPPFPLEMAIDLNADLGEGAPGQGEQGDRSDEVLMRSITSANIACGVHAGSPSTMAAAMDAAKKFGVAVGAHPSYPDREHFGRRSVRLGPGTLRDVLLYQLGAFSALARVRGLVVTHVKPHGALYNDAAGDPALADVVAATVAGFDRSLIVVGLAGSRLTEAARRHGLRAADEAFCDRRYESDGTLRSRNLPDALILDPEEAARQAYRIVLEGRVQTAAGTDVALRAQTLCIHGDSPKACAIAAAVRARLEAAGVSLTHLEHLV